MKHCDNISLLTHHIPINTSLETSAIGSAEIRMKHHDDIIYDSNAIT